MSTRDLIDAIASGDSVAIQQSFENEMAGRIAERLDVMRQEVAKNMFSQQEEVNVEEEVDDNIDLDEAMDGTKVHPNAIHVQHVGGGKYKVHAVGKNFDHGIKAGEHLSDSDLDDFSEMGGKIKHVK
jgi:hypothetical protein